MQSLTDLNSHSRTIIEVADSRPSGVVLDRNATSILDQRITAATSIVIPTAVNIVEVINYATANVRFRVTINTPSPALTPTSMSWAVIPAGLTLTTVGQEYTVSGIKTAAEWDIIKNPTWTIPSTWSSYPIWSLTCEIIWYDDLLAADQRVQWPVYDPNFYYTAQLVSQSSLTCLNSKFIQGAAAMSVTAELRAVLGIDIVSESSLTCSITKFKGTSATLSASASVLSAAVSDFFVLNYSVSAGETIAMGLAGVNTVSINWGDGTGNTYTTSGTISHTYATAGTKKVTLIGNYQQWVDSTTDKSALIRVLTFPTDTLTSLAYAFDSCTGIIEMPTTLGPKVTDLRYCFTNSTFNLPAITSWNTANVTNMAGMFYKNTSFDQNIGSWNTAKVVDMSYMFAGSSSGYTIFNQNIGSWNTALVTNMERMFFDNRLFNQDIGSWNVQNVTKMTNMFRGEVSQKTAFNQNISAWNTANVTIMNGMFANSVFNQPINTWNVSKVTDFTSMFSGNRNFNQSLSSWNTIGATTMNSMFFAAVFNQPINSWNVSNVTDMSSMFAGSSSFGSLGTVYNPFNQPLLDWNTAKVVGMTFMFSYNNSFDQDISVWPVPLIATKPLNFDQNSNASWITAEKPQWGT